MFVDNARQNLFRQLEQFQIGTNPYNEMHPCSSCKPANTHARPDGGSEGGSMSLVYLWIGGTWVFALKFGFCHFRSWYHVILKTSESTSVENWTRQRTRLLVWDQLDFSSSSMFSQAYKQNLINQTEIRPIKFIEGKTPAVGHPNNSYLYEKLEKEIGLLF